MRGGTLAACAAALVAVAGCAGGPRGAQLASHAFGDSPAFDPAVLAIAVREVEVSAPSWLDSAALQYRLAYDSPTRRYGYRDSRWAAPPGELVAQLLRKAVIAPAPGAGGCRLRVALEEFEQRFDAPQASRAVLALHAELVAPRGGARIAARRFELERAAASADARGGAQALAQAAAALAGEVRAWLGGLDAGARCGG